MHQMKVIGITGGVGSGKSTILTLLKEHFNSYIIMADDVAKETMEPGQPGYQKVIELFGDEILNQDKTINRKKLAEIVFSSPNKRIVLNSIIHPLVKKSILEKINELKIKEEYDYIFIEAALLIEDHYEVICDELWYIYVPQVLRRDRLKASRGYSDEKIDNIFHSQLSEEVYTSKCQHRIDNSQGLDFTMAQLVKLL
jgi:dephospho-CoA kinase